VKRFATWSSVAFLPAIVVLGRALHPLAAVYLASFVVMVVYHQSYERRWRKVDHAFAWAVIASNCYLALETHHVLWSLGGVALVFCALPFYRGARVGRYSWRHGWWHVLSGAACWCFARGMLG
jgi:hypothetical protein